MGPNGSGKSTLANILSGKKGYEVSGSLKFEGKNFKTFQSRKEHKKEFFWHFNILEIPGVNTTNFLKLHSILSGNQKDKKN